MKEAKAAGAAAWKRAYRDPHTASPSWKNLIKAEGWRGAARRRVQAEELLGRLGWAGWDVRRPDRAAGPGLCALRGTGAQHQPDRIVEAERQAEHDYKASVTVQMERDKVGGPETLVGSRRGAGGGPCCRESRAAG